MISFLLSMVVLSALIFAGYHVNMYLYQHGMVKRARGQDKDLLSARIGLAILVGFVVVLVVLGVSVLALVFR